MAVRTSQLDQIFYTTEVQAERACLRDEEMRHATKVLRRRIGDVIDFTDGNGRIYQGRIASANRHEAWLDIESEIFVPPSPFRLTIAMAPTKSLDRITWCIEKLTEIGMYAFVPLLCDRSEREKWNAGRIERVAVSAMKQSRRAYLPQLQMPQEFKSYVPSAIGLTTQGFIALQDGKALMDSGVIQNRDITILIGPEGDFTHEEMEMAGQHNFVALSLGDFRLRTETAAIVAAVMMHTVNQQ